MKSVLYLCHFFSRGLLQWRASTAIFPISEELQVANADLAQKELEFDEIMGSFVADRTKWTNLRRDSWLGTES